MKYLLLVCEKPTDAPEETEEVLADRAAQVNEELIRWFAEIDKRGSRLIGAALSEPTSAATVRVRDAEVIISDGPFAETKELIGGFDVIECPSMADAVEIAALHPVAAFGMVEVRPFDSEWREPGT